MTTVMFLGGPRHGEFETMPGLPPLVLEVAVIDNEAPTYADFDIENPAASMPTIRRERYRLIQRCDGTFVYVQESSPILRVRELWWEFFLHPGPLRTYMPDRRWSRDRSGLPRENYQNYLSPDAHSMSFADMTEEAEAELAAWRGILHPE